MSKTETLHVCPRCKGEGYLMNRGQQLALGIVTFGMAPLIDAALSDGPRDSLLSRKCNVCKGRGVVAFPDATAAGDRGQG